MYLFKNIFCYTYANLEQTSLLQFNTIQFNSIATTKETIWGIDKLGIQVNKTISI